jgi:hypothetical protein
LYTEDVSVDGIKIWPQSYHDGWEMLTIPGLAVPSIAVWRGYYDTQGFNLEELTFFPTNPQVQESGPFLSDMNGVLVTDMITVKPITNADIEKMAPDTAELSSLNPGFLHSSHDLQDIIYGKWVYYNPSSIEAQAPVVSQSGTYGLNTPTGRDRIFITRVVNMGAANNQYAQIAPCAFVLGGVTAEEKDLVHLERLRRNFDHSSKLG